MGLRPYHRNINNIGTEVTRKITIAGVKLEVSKNEAKEAGRIASMRTADPLYAQRAFDTWLNAATPEARARRVNVGIAIGLKAPQ